MGRLTAADKAAIEKAAGEFRAISLAASTLYEMGARIFPASKQLGLKEIQRLKALNLKGKLQEGLKDYRWSEDKINHVPPPWVIALKRFDDCDGSSWLINEVVPTCSIFCIARIENGKPKDFEKWHFVVQTAENDTWSNFKNEGEWNIVKYARHYWSKATHLIHVTKGIDVQEITVL